MLVLLEQKDHKYKLENFYRSEYEFTATDRFFDSKMRADCKPVSVGWCANWCGPCRMMAPLFHELAIDAGCGNVGMWTKTPKLPEGLDIEHPHFARLQEWSGNGLAHGVNF
jgi:hypothetical protein